MVVTSKVVAVSQGRAVAKDQTDKEALVRQQADRYIDSHQSRYGVTLTIKDHLLAVNAGLDQSNADQNYVLLPSNSYQSARQLWHFLRRQYAVERCGVVISDSTTFPLKWGVIGRALGYCGFVALNDLIGRPDLYHQPMSFTKVNVAEGIAAAAVLEMGEAAEQTPLCLVEDVTHLRFQDRPPTSQELEDLLIEPEDDVFAPVLLAAPWQRG